MQQCTGMIYTEKFLFEPGKLIWEGDTIKDIVPCDAEMLTEAEKKRYLLPGLVDIHFHGCAGYDFCDGTKEAFAAISEYELRHGITTICPATMTFSEEKLAAVCRACAVYAEEDDGEPVSFAEMLGGIYLEGPFISYEKRGAQNPACISKPDIAMLERLQTAAGGRIKIVAIAPEEEGGLNCIAAGKDRFRFSIAHTCADYDMAGEAIKAGAVQVTHLYNAMLPFSHRAPGVAGAAADAEEVMAELICDGVHIHPAMVRSTFKLFGENRIILVSDSMMAAGMPDGDYFLGGQAVKVQGTHALLEDGTIAGSVSDLFDCMRAAIAMGVPKEAVIRAASMNPARAIGMADRCGSLKAGKRADILVTDEDLNLLQVIKSGKCVPGMAEVNPIRV